MCLFSGLFGLIIANFAWNYAIRRRFRSTGSVLKTMDNEARLFSEKAQTYLVCFNDGCARSGECMRRRLAGYVPSTRRIVESVNAGYVAARGGQCEYFRQARPVTMHKGLTRFYDQIPERTARMIRKALISDFGNSNYYRYRSGELLITPAVEEHISQVCRRLGWTDGLAFDEEQQEYQW